jgi:hypothetical protein
MDMQFQWTEAEYVSAQVAYQKRHWFPYIYSYRLPIGMVVVAAAFMCFHPESYQVGGSIMAVGFGLILYVAISYRWRWRRDFRAHPALQKPIAITVAGDSIRLSREKAERVIQWNEITDIYESPRGFFFSTTKRKVPLLVPKLSMTDVQIAELRNIVSVNARGKVRLAGV